MQFRMTESVVCLCNSQSRQCSTKAVYKQQEQQPAREIYHVTLHWRGAV